MEEIWKDIIGYENLYQVSSFGRVKSLDRVEFNGWSNTRKRTGKILKDTVSRRYHRIQLSKNGIAKKYFVHTLVARAFPEICGEWFEGAEINHKDENPENNCAWNLEWVSHYVNNTYGTRTERAAATKKRSYTNKHVLQFDLNHNFIKEWVSAVEIQRTLNISNSAIYACCNHKKHFNTAGGFIWEWAS